ncbi:hypothetical protein M4Z58_21555, partial [Escherichia coli]|nr:hypothetical protein [Escherichia coli]
MTGKLRFEVNDNQGCFIFPETWFGSLLDEFEELIDAYDADEISETSYINKLRRLARQENDFIDVHAHLAYVFLGNDSNLLIVFYVQIMPDDFVMQLHR